MAGTNPGTLTHHDLMITTLNLNWITNYIWVIGNDVLRDLYVRGKYRDVILPMTVLRRLAVVLEDTKQAVLDMKTDLDTLGVVEQNLPCGRQRERISPGQVLHLRHHTPPIAPAPR